MGAARVAPRPGDPSSWYPAGWPGVSARFLTLAGEDRARVVETETCLPALPVLLLHGLGANSFHFRRLLPELARRRVRPIALDLRGHGMSHKPAGLAPYTAGAMTDFVLRVLDALELDAVGLVGHSLGGAIALDAAAAAPERVLWLALLNPVGFTALRFAPLLVRSPVGLAELLPASISRAVAWGSMRHAYGSLRGPDRGDLEQYLYPALLRGGRHGILAMARAFDWSARPASAFERITCRSVALFGRRDRVIGYDAAAACSRAMRRAIVSSVDNGGHVLAEESPEAVLRAVDGLLDAAEPAAPNAARHDRAAIP